MIRLPDELLVHVLSFLPPDEAARVGRVCRRLREIAHDDPLWRLLFPKSFPYTEVPQVDCKATFLTQRSRLRLLRAPYILAGSIHNLDQNEKIIWKASSSFLTCNRATKLAALYSYEKTEALLRFPLVSSSDVAFSLAYGNLCVREGKNLVVMSLANKNCIFAETECDPYPILLTKEFLVYFKGKHVIVRRLQEIHKEFLNLPLEWVPGLISLNGNLLTITAKDGEELVSINILTQKKTPHHFPGYAFDHLSPHYLILHDQSRVPRVCDLIDFTFIYDIPLPANKGWEAKIVAPDRLQIKYTTTNDHFALHDIPNKKRLYHGDGPLMRYHKQQEEFILLAFGKEDSQIVHLKTGQNWRIPGTEGFIEAINADGSLSVAKVQAVAGFFVYRCRPKEIPAHLSTRQLIEV